MMQERLDSDLSLETPVEKKCKWHYTVEWGSLQPYPETKNMIDILINEARTQTAFPIPIHAL
jgi:hypothetical protein